MALEIILNKVDLSCYESSNGYVWVSISGGSAPYTTSWVTPSGGDVVSTNLSARGLSAGEYFCTVTDSLGAQVTDSIEVDQPEYEAPLEGLGMTLCYFQKCFLPYAMCQVGNLAYKYFVDYPEQGIDCDDKQDKILWAINTIETLRCWNPEDEDDEQCLTAEQAGELSEKLKQVLSACNINQLVDITA